MTPTNANGKVCYIEIPAEDVARSAEFYRAVFGWEIRTRSTGATAFDDGVEVSGTFVPGRPPAREAGFLIYVMVADAEATLTKIAAHNGEIVEPVRPGAPEMVARFRDPAGNLPGHLPGEGAGEPGLTGRASEISPARSRRDTRLTSCRFLSRRGAEASRRRLRTRFAVSPA